MRDEDEQHAEADDEDVVSLTHGIEAAIDILILSPPSL